MKIRPDWIILELADPKSCRCMMCNRGGMNRTGILPLGYRGSSTTSMWGVKCDEPGCTDGWIDDGNIYENKELISPKTDSTPYCTGK